MALLSQNPDITPPPQPVQHPRRLLMTIIGATLLFFVLGVGNVLIGMLKSNEYNALVKKAHYEMAHDDRPVIPLVDGSLDVNSHSLHIKRLEYRLAYYNLVELGGKVFLALAGILVLCCLLIKNAETDKTSSR